MTRFSRGLAALAVAVLAACGGGGGGGGSESAPSNEPPRAIALASGDARALANGGLGATVGGVVRLDASTSTDPESDALTFTWTLTARPTDSAASLVHTSTAAIELRPDVLGNYTLSLKVTDSKGASSTQQVLVAADNRLPVAGVVATPQFTPVPTVAPQQTISVGASVVVDASGSLDPDGDAPSMAFTLVARPAGSATSLVVQGKTARFTADVAGVYKVQTVGTDAQGASFQHELGFTATNQAPNPVLLARADPVVSDAGEQTLAASVGYDIVLDGSASSDPEQQPLTYLWTLASRPTGSVAALSSTTGSGSGFSPDVLGEYLVTLAVSDPAGASNVRRLRVQVNNRRPLAQIGSSAMPQSLLAAPRIRVPAGTELTLRGSLSSDGDGDPITYRWALDARPAESTSVLSSTTAADPQFTPDRDGSYVLRLRVTDPSGAFSERIVTVEVGGHAPVAIVDRNLMTLLLGSTARASAASSFDDDGDGLRYSWALSARPAGSAATLTGNTPELSFTPDLVGTYVAAVTVRDATRASIAYVTIRVLPVVGHVTSLPFAPNTAHYSLGLDKLVVVTRDPISMRIIDPFTGLIRSLALPATVKNFSLSPDGRLALVVHDGSITLVDLEAARIVRSSATGGSRTDGWVSNAGIAFLVGQTGGQWVRPGVLVFDARTGDAVPQVDGGSFYGTQYGVMAGRLNRMFVVSQGLSPTSLSYFAFDPATSLLTVTGSLTAPGDSSFSAPLFMSENEDLLFSASGYYFRTDTLASAGRLVTTGPIASLSHSANLDEALALVSVGVSNGWGYPSSYTRYAGPQFVPDTTLSVPPISGAPAYGIKIFHSASGRHVILAQTGTSEPGGAGAAYVVIVR